MLTDDDIINLFAKEYEQVPQISPDEAVRRAGRAIEAAVRAEAKQEPVAWRDRERGDRVIGLPRKPEEGDDGWEPLYAAPVVQPGMVEKLREMLQMLLQESNTKAALFKTEDMLREMIAAAQEEEK